VWSVVLAPMIIWASPEVKDDNGSASVAPAFIAGAVWRRWTCSARPPEPAAA